jgi:hypothetical protein
MDRMLVNAMHEIANEMVGSSQSTPFLSQISVGERGGGLYSWVKWRFEFVPQMKTVQNP